MLECRVALGEAGYVAEVEDVMEGVNAVNESALIPGGTPAEAANEAVKAVSDAASDVVVEAASKGEDGGALFQIVLSILVTLSFALLFLLTAGVGYLSYKSWQDDKASKNEAESLMNFANTSESNKDKGTGPTLSKVGRGFAKKGKGRALSGTSGAKKKSIADVKKPAPSTSQGGGGLPEGWKSYVDSKSGKEYYHNEGTNTTQWEKPGV